MIIYEGYFNDKSSDNDEIVRDVEISDAEHSSVHYEHFIEMEFIIKAELADGLYKNNKDSVKLFSGSVLDIEKKIKRMESGFPFIESIGDKFVITNSEVDYKSAIYPKKIGEVTVMTDKLDRVQMISFYLKFFINYSFHRIKQVDKFNRYLMLRISTPYTCCNGYYIDDEEHSCIYQISDTSEQYYYYGESVIKLSNVLIDDNKDVASMCLDYYAGNNAAEALMCVMNGDNYYKCIDIPVSKNVVADVIKTYDSSEYNIVNVYPCGKLNKPVWSDTKIRNYIFSNKFTICFKATVSQMTVYIVCDGYYNDEIVTLLSKCSEYKKNSNCDIDGFKNIIEMLKTVGCTSDEINDVVKHMSIHVIDNNLFNDYLEHPERY